MCRFFNFEVYLMRCWLLAALAGTGLMFSADRASAQAGNPAPGMGSAPQYPMVRTWSAPYVYSTYSMPVFVTIQPWTGSMPATAPQTYFASYGATIMYPPPVLQVGYTTYAPINRTVWHGYRGW